jgi:hypothetical protein
VRAIIGFVVNVDGSCTLSGHVVWLTVEQGGRVSGPPPTKCDYAHTAYVPPHTVDIGLASFVLRGYEPGAWTSRASGRWLDVRNEGVYRIEPGSVVVCTEGRRSVAYFHVDGVDE